MGAIDLVDPDRGAAVGRVGHAAHRARRPLRRRAVASARSSRSTAATCSRRRWSSSACWSRPIEETRIPRNPLDVLAQQIVAICAHDRWTVDDLHRLVTRAESFRDLSREQLEGVLDMLSGRYPSDEFADLKPRLVWDRLTDEVVVAQRRAGRGHHLGRHDPGPRPVRRLPARRRRRARGRRVGELDEEMVYESRVGETFLLGASTWRIEEIRPDRVIVTPAPGEPGKMPFWHGDAIGRPIELGRAIGAFLRELEPMKPVGGGGAPARGPRARRAGGAQPRRLPRRAARGHRRAADRPHDRGRALPRRARRLAGRAPHAVRRPRPRAVVDGDRGAPARAPRRRGAVDLVRRRHRRSAAGGRRERRRHDRVAPCCSSPTRSRTCSWPSSAARRCSPRASARTPPARCCCRDAGRGSARRCGCSASARPTCWRSPASTARSRSSSRRTARSCATSSTCRRCVELLGDIRARRIRVVSVETRSASPFASSLLFDYVGSFMYEGDAPLAERRAQALALDRELLAELLGSEELRELLDPEAVAELELELQALAPIRRARTIDGVADLLRRLGDLRDRRGRGARRRRRRGRRARRARARPGARCASGSPARSAGSRSRTSARYRDAVGASPPPGVAETFLAAARRPARPAAARWARTHAPFTADAPAGALGRGAAPRSRRGCARWRRPARCWRAPSAPAARPTSSPIPTSCASCGAARWRACGARSSRSSPTRSPASCRPGRASARPPAASGAWSRSVAQLEGVPIPASVLERDVLPARVAGYTPRLLDELGAAGRGGLDRPRRARPRRRAGRPLPARPRRPAGRAPAPPSERPSEPVHDAIRQHLQRRGASFFPQLRAAVAERAPTTSCSTRCGTSSGPARSRTTRSRRCAPCRCRARDRRRSPRPGRLMALGPPRAAGRWSLVADLVGEERSPTERGHALATALLERHGVVTREAVAAEGIAGRLRVGLPGAARHGGVRPRPARLLRRRPRRRAVRPARRGRPAARDPRRRADGAPAGRHRPGAAVRRGARRGRAATRTSGCRSSARPARTSSIVDGHAALYLERGGRGLLRFPPRHDAGRERAVAALAVPRRARRTDARAADRARRPRAGGRVGAGASARAAGFRPSYRGFLLRSRGRRRVTSPALTATAGQGPSTAWRPRGRPRRGS